MVEFRVNQNMLDVIQSFNKLDQDQADVFLSRIFQSPYSSYTELFTQKERDKLLKKVNIEESEILRIIKGFSFILLQAVAERNFQVIQSALKDNGLKGTHLSVFQENWDKYNQEITNKMREKPVAIQQEMNDFNWSIQIPFENSKLPLKNAAIIRGGAEDKIDNYEELFSIDARNPTVVMNFTVKHNSDVTDDSKTQEFAFRLTKGQIQTLFENMDILQEQLDQLS